MRTRNRWFLLALGAPLYVAACGSDVVHNPDYGQPPDGLKLAFRPGDATPTGADAYGSGSGATTGSHPQDTQCTAHQYRARLDFQASIDPAIAHELPAFWGGALPRSLMSQAESTHQVTDPTSCPPDLSLCPVEITFPSHGEMSVELRGDWRGGAWTQGDAMTLDGNTWKVTIQAALGKPVQYKFFVDGKTWTTDPGQPLTADKQNNDLTQVACTNPTCNWDPPPPPPGVWDWRDSTLYFVFVDRFKDGNAKNNCGPTVCADAPGDYKGGDWAGVTQQINSGYFDEIGVNTLWVTVPIKNADKIAGHGVSGDTHMYSAYHGYWPDDPNQLEPCFGTDDELKGLVDAAHAKGLKVIFDYAMVHVHSSSAIYQQHPDWFWPNSKDGHDCICGGACSWDTDYQRCWFTDYLPHWNYTNADGRAFSVKATADLVRKTGVDGFRLDAIKHIDSSWMPALRQELASIFAAQTPKQRFYMVGETYDFGNRDFIKSFVDPTTKLDGQFDFPLRYHLMKALLLQNKVSGDTAEDMKGFSSWMDSNDGYYGRDAIMSTFIGNHDLPRSIHMAEDNPVWTNPYTDGKDRAWTNQPGLPSGRSAFERLANAFAVLFTNKGMPLVYYGDEVGLPGAGDPDNRRVMQFDNLTSDQQFLKTRLKLLGTIRAAHPALRRGHRITLSATADTWVYSMTSAEETVYVAINRGDADQNVTGLPGSSLHELVTDQSVNGANLSVPARQVRILVTP
jgi:glycosidase